MNSKNVMLKIELIDDVYKSIYKRYKYEMERNRYIKRRKSFEEYLQDQINLGYSLKELDEAGKEINNERI